MAKTDTTDTAAPADGNTQAGDQLSTPQPPAKKAKKAKASRKKDGTVGDFKGDTRAFNERPPTVTKDDRGRENVEAEFRSATGHNTDKSVGGVNP